MAQPTFNHTRADGPFDPCPECKALMTPKQLEALRKDQEVVKKIEVEEAETTCDKCGKEFPDSGAFLLHMGIQHKETVRDLLNLPAFRQAVLDEEEPPKN
jgi:hypothetical protein